MVTKAPAGVKTYLRHGESPPGGEMVYDGPRGGRFFYSNPQDPAHAKWVAQRQATVDSVGVQKLKSAQLYVLVPGSKASWRR
jgi:hypothetical protein